MKLNKTLQIVAAVALFTGLTFSASANILPTVNLPDASANIPMLAIGIGSLVALRKMLS